MNYILLFNAENDNAKDLANQFNGMPFNDVDEIYKEVEISGVKAWEFELRSLRSFVEAFNLEFIPDCVWFIAHVTTQEEV